MGLEIKWWDARFDIRFEKNWKELNWPQEWPPSSASYSNYKDSFISMCIHTLKSVINNQKLYNRECSYIKVHLPVLVEAYLQGKNHAKRQFFAYRFWRGTSFGWISNETLQTSLDLVLVLGEYNNKQHWITRGSIWNSVERGNT